MNTTLRKRIPKLLRVARPMTTASARHPSRWLRFDVLAIVIAIVIAAVAPLQTLDDVATSATLRALSSQQPSPSVFVVTAAPKDLQTGSCAQTLRTLLERGGARAALLLPPADVFCSDDDVVPATAQSVPVMRLAPELLRWQDNQVVGFAASDESTDGAMLTTLGLIEAPWIVPKAQRSVAALSFSDLSEKRVSPSALNNRVVIVALGIESVPASDEAMSPAKSTAALLGGLLDGGRRTPTPNWVPPLLVGLAGVLLLIARRRFSSLITASILVAIVLVFLCGQALAISYFEASLLPLTSCLLGIVVAFSGVISAHALDSKQAIDKGAEMLQRSRLLRMQEVHTLSDEEFWHRIARFAKQAFPSEIVLVAELPPRQWHLRFWNEQRGGESLVAERRRDVRRAPYSNEQGIPTTRVVQRFLTKQDIPSVVVPVIAFGEIEGYVFFCGATSEAAFSQEPDRVDRVARELALMIRHRRLGRVQPFRASEATQQLLEGSRIALGDLEIFNAVLRNAPVGLLYADAFGDVRLLAREFTAWLRAHNVAVSADSHSGLLAPGTLSLGDILKAASSDTTSVLLSNVMASEQGIDIPISVPSPSVLHIRPLRQDVDGLSWLAGYVATLKPVSQVAGATTNVRTLGTREMTDPLCAFAFGEVVAEAVATAGRATGRPVRLEPIRVVAHAIGHRTELSQALEAFLIDVAERGLPGHGPTVSVREASSGVQLCVFDIGFGLGLPESALQRVLMAPSAAPAGLEPLGRVVLAVEDSHGSVELVTTDGWGITLTITLHRAHPRVTTAAPSSAAVISINRANQK